MPGAVCIPWRTDHEPVPNDVCLERARAAVEQLLPTAERLGVKLTMENIFFNGFHVPEALVFQTGDSLDRMLGRKTYVPG